MPGIQFFAARGGIRHAAKLTRDTTRVAFTVGAKNDFSAWNEILGDRDDDPGVCGRVAGVERFGG
jgi:hypothetical protein